MPSRVHLLVPDSSKLNNLLVLPGPSAGNYGGGLFLGVCGGVATLHSGLDYAAQKIIASIYIIVLVKTILRGYSSK